MWWPGIDGDIERWIGSCATCASVRAAPPRDPPAPWPAAAGPWQRVHIDYLTVGQRVYLVLVDSFSKWIECVYMHNTSTKSLILKLKVIFSTFGIPNVLVSDNDVKINSNEFKTFCSFNGIKYMTSPIYHPPSNGQAENTVRTCKKMLKCILKENCSPSQINELLLGYLFNYRNALHCTTGDTPAKLMFGRELRSRLDLILPLSKEHTAPSSVPVRRHFIIGDVVWTRWYGARKETWQLGIIRDKIGNKMYNIFVKDFNICCIRHVDQIVKYTGNVEFTRTSANVPQQLQSTEVEGDGSRPSTTGPNETPPGSEAECAADDGEEWGDCEADREDGRIVASDDATVTSPPTHSEIRMSGQSQDVATQNNDELPPTTQNDYPSATHSRQKRNKKIVDYKKFF